MSDQPDYTYPNQPQPPQYAGQYQQTPNAGQYQQGAYVGYTQMYGQQLPEHMEKPVAPKALKIGALLVYCIAGLNVVAQVLQIFFYKELEALQEETLDKFLGTSDFTSLGMSSYELSNELLTFTLISSLVFSIVWNAATVVFALCMVKGQNWARIVLTIYSALLAFGIFSVLSWFVVFHWTRIFEPICALLAIAALVFFWQRPANEYMRQSRIYKQWVHQQSYFASRR